MYFLQPTEVKHCNAARNGLTHPKALEARAAGSHAEGIPWEGRPCAGEVPVQAEVPAKPATVAREAAGLFPPATTVVALPGSVHSVELESTLLCQFGSTFASPENRKHEIITSFR